jgi:hypothetical protein
MIKKSYNPFKMLGSWIGLISSWLWVSIELNLPESSNQPLIIEKILPASNWGYIYIYLLIYMIIGFISGWAIHVLIKSLKN